MTGGMINIPKKTGSKITGTDIRASSIGWELALPIVTGPVVGYLIDRYYKTGATFTLVFLGIGLALGIGNLIRFIFYEYSFLKNAEKQKKDE